MIFLRRSRRQSGFSLVEMLLACSILPIILFAVFANMSSGMRVWKAFNRPVSEEDTVVFLDRARTDFSNAFLYQSVPFAGDSVEVQFAGPLQTFKELGGDNGIGRVGYRYDESKNAIIRTEWNVADLHKQSSGRSKAVLSGVSGMSIEYLSFVPTESAYIWKEAWQPSLKPLPAAVRLTISQQSGETLVKTFLVPCGN